MNLELISEIRRKEKKDEAEEELLKYFQCLSYISSVLVQESKFHYTSEEAIIKIREFLTENL